MIDIAVTFLGILFICWHNRISICAIVVCGWKMSSALPKASQKSGSYRISGTARFTTNANIYYRD